MKTRYVYLTAALILVLVLLVVWKLNDYYKDDKIALMQEQMHQQVASIKSSVSSQITQLKNILSSYTGAVEESRINWVQMQPFFALAQIEITPQRQYQVEKIFTKSGTPAERWTASYLQKALSFKKHSGQAVVAKLFEDKSGQKFLALIFSTEKVAVVGEASYFQKFFDLQRTNRITNAMLTSDQIVAAHSEYDYVATQTEEANLDPGKYLIEKDEIRATNLSLISYASNKAIAGGMNIPPAILGLVLGFSLVLIGVLYYALAPVERAKRQNKQAQRDLMYQKTLEESKAGVKTLADDVSAVSAKKTAAEKPVSEIKLIEKPQKAQKPSLPPTVEDVPRASALDIAKNIVDVTQQQAPQEVRLSTLQQPLEQVLQKMKPTLDAASIKIETELTTQAQYEIDVTRFVKAYENILKNAIEALANSENKVIQVRAYDVGRTTFVEIQDSGPGIEPQQIEKIWQPFYTTKNKSQHMGLGLTEALSIARRYGADLQVVTAEGTKGTLIRLAMTEAIAEKSGDMDMIEDLTPPLETIEPKKAAASGAAQLSSQPTLQPTIPELDIDAILNLEDRNDIESATAELTRKMPSIDLEKELTTTQFKVDRHIDVVENPKIEMKQDVKSVDQFAVKVRRPGKS